MSATTIDPAAAGEAADPNAVPTGGDDDTTAVKPPLWRDPYFLAGAAVVVVGLVWWAARPQRPRASVTVLERPCRDCGKGKDRAYAYMRSDGSAADDDDPVGAAVDPQGVVVAEPVDRGFDQLEVEVPGNLPEPLDDVAVPVAPDERVGDLV